MDNLGRDPESRGTSNDAIVILNLATSESWSAHESGDRRQQTEWHRVIIFSERLGENAVRYLRKGSKLYVEGSLRTRKWQDQSGPDRCIARTTGRPAGLVRSLSQAPLRLPGSLMCRPANIPQHRHEHALLSLCRGRVHPLIRLLRRW
ncbi:MAG: single-stranded DNA-binding protein [Hyphomicrobium sp.]